MMPAVTSDSSNPGTSTEKSAGKPPARGIYLLPNLLTTGCLFSGFYSIVAAIDRAMDQYAVLVFPAQRFDDASQFAFGGRFGKIEGAHSTPTRG